MADLWDGLQSPRMVARRWAAVLFGCLQELALLAAPLYFLLMPTGFDNRQLKVSG